MANNQEKIFYIGTRAAEDPKNAAMSLVKTWAALTMNIKATIPLQGNAVF